MRILITFFCRFDSHSDVDMAQIVGSVARNLKCKTCENFNFYPSLMLIVSELFLMKKNCKRRREIFSIFSPLISQFVLRKSGGGHTREERKRTKTRGKFSENSKISKWRARVCFASDDPDGGRRATKKKKKSREIYVREEFLVYKAEVNIYLRKMGSHLLRLKKIGISCASENSIFSGGEQFEANS